MDFNVTVCIGIPTLLREQVLLDTLGQVFAQDSLPDEIIVADQTASHDPATAAQLQQWASSGRLHLLDLDNPSLTASRNAILRASTCDYVLFIDDDVFLPKEYVARFRAAFAAREIAMLAGAVIESASSTAIDDLPSEEPAPVQLRLQTQDSIDEHVRGCNMAVHRLTALHIGGFDEQF